MQDYPELARSIAKYVFSTDLETSVFCMMEFFTDPSNNERAYYTMTLESEEKDNEKTEHECQRKDCNTTKDLKRCSKCKSVYYCSIKCQNSD